MSVEPSTPVVPPSSSGDPSDRIAAARASGPLAARLLNLTAMLAPRFLPAERLAPELAGPQSVSATGPGLLRETAEACRGLEELGLLRVQAPDGASRGDVDDGAAAPTGATPGQGEEGAPTRLPPPVGWRVYMPAAIQPGVREELPRPVAAGAVEAAFRVVRQAVEDGGQEPPRAFLPHAAALAERSVELGRPPDRALALGGRLLAAAAAQGVDRELLDTAESLEAVAEESRGLEDPFLAAALADQRAALLASEGRAGEACRRAEAALEHAESVLETDDPRLALLHYNAGGLYKGMGRAEEGVTHFRRARRLLESNVSTGSDLQARVLLDLAECLLMAERFPAAGKVAQAAVLACRRHFGPEHPETEAAETAARRAEGGAGGQRAGTPPGGD